jgi:hypothetical protein
VRPSHRTSELRVPTLSVAVRLAVVGASPIAVELFLPDVARRGRAQLLDDVAALLAADARFVPVRCASRIRLLAKHAISWVAVSRHGSADQGLELVDEPPAVPGSSPAGALVGAAVGAPGAPIAAPGSALASAFGAQVGTPAVVGDALLDAPDDFDESAEELTLFDHQHFVEVELAHGAKLIGTLLDSAPADHSRVIDHLNRAGPFLRLWTTDQHYLISTAQVVAVTELGEVW